MNDRLPRISAAEAVRVLEKAGFFQRATSQDPKEHFKRRKPDRRRISIADEVARITTNLRKFGLYLKA
jgi:predicted RNA binding protein YcfA (HicA-like mRNA interferase family)